MKLLNIPFSTNSIRFSLLFISLNFFLIVPAQQVVPYQPTRNQVLDSYKKAAYLDSVAPKSVLNTNLFARWQDDGNGFWYKKELHNGEGEYIYVNAKNGKKSPAFDQAKMAEALGKLIDTTLSDNRLPITDIQYDKDHKNVFVSVKRKWYQCNLTTYDCKELDSTMSRSLNRNNRMGRGGFGSRWERQEGEDSLSPDKKWVAYIDEGNLFVKSVSAGEKTQLTSNGDTSHPYGQFQWAPDSKSLVIYHINPVEEKPVYYLLSAVKNTTRAIVKSHPYAQPGDPFTSYEMFTVNIVDKKLIKVNTELYDFLGYPRIHWRNGDNRYFVYEKADRGHQRYRMIEVNVETGNTRNLIDEKTKTFIYQSRIFTYYTKKGNEIIWSSEKDGWNQLYLVDGVKGGVKNRITSGNWVVRGIDSIDEKKREIWFTASGINQGEDPYNIHNYRIGFDGKNMVSLTAASGNHQVRYSPDKTYFVDTYSTPEIAPVSELHRSFDGKLITTLETADISGYKDLGLPLPEVFVAKARDGVTDIWGIVCRPSNLDPTKKYPVIENIYAGPQDAYVPKNFMRYGEMQSLAELGFIVIQSDGMGTANRSKAFHDVCWKNIADAGLPDRILWIKTLSKKYSYVDDERVGIYGTSAGGQNSLGALLFHPEFYKVAVSAAGCHDNRVDKQWWNEQWMGYPVGPWYEEQSNVTNAHKLKGDLLLIVGEADTNVPPESTFRVVDALIKADKVFDFLMVPGMDHSDGGPYGKKKRRDFFVKHLLQVDPPERNHDELKD